MENIKCGMFVIMAGNIEPKDVPIHLGLALQSFNNKMFDTAEEIARGLRLSHEEYYTYGAFEQWRNDKILTILNEGSENTKVESNQKDKPNRSLKTLLMQLGNKSIETGVSYSSKKDNQLTCVVFLADERVFNKVKYPDFNQFLKNHPDIISTFEKDRSYASIVEEITNFRSTVYLDWVHSIGGERNEFLRGFLNDF